MPVKPPCCGACKDKMNSCRMDVACCLECHFAFEEDSLFPYLPNAQQHKLRREHRMLRNLGFPPDLVAEHAAREMLPFRRYCPAELVDQVERDHIEFDEGRLHTRAEVFAR